MPVDLAHVELLCLAVVDGHQVVQLRRCLIQVARQLLLLVVLGLEVVGASAAFVGAARATLRVDGAGITVGRDEVVDLSLHVGIDVQVLPEEVLAEGEVLE